MHSTIAPSHATVDPAAETFAAFAPHYDLFSREYRHDRWLTTLARLAREHGLPGRDVLDVACGTGKSLAPLVARGFRVVGCDISPEMLAVACEHHPQVEFHEADMRDLPDIGRFSWITCINDAINYMLGDDDLRRTLRSMAARLVPDGLVTFDLTSAAAHHEIYTQTSARADGDSYMCWRGLGCDSGVGAIGHAELAIFTRAGESWDRTDSCHLQRLWTTTDVEQAAAWAGLDVTAIYGQRPGCIVEPELDDRHTKVVYLLRRRRLDDSAQ